MRTKTSNILWGLAFVAAGVIVIGNIIDLWDFSVFFRGWWTLFIIIPCIISMVTNGFHSGNLIGLGIGVLLLLGAQKVITGDLAGKLIFPVILIIIGLSILLGGHGHVKHVKFPKSDGNSPEYASVFSGRDLSFAGQVFTGADFTSVFGGFDVDLREAQITQDVVIHATAIFGGADFRVPQNVKIVVSGTPIFGGTSMKAVQSSDPAAPTVYFNTFCAFGGIEITN